MVRGIDADLDDVTEAERCVITEYLRRVVGTMRRHASGQPEPR